LSRRDTALALTVALLWGVNFIFIRIGLDAFPPILFASLRFAVSALPVVVLRRPGVPWRWVVAVGATTGCLQFAFLFSGMAAGLSTGLTSLVIQSQSGFSVLLSALFLAEPVRRGQVAGLLVAGAGIVVIAAQRGGAVTLAGVALVLFAAFWWAVGNVFIRVAKPPDALSFICWISVLPPLPLLALSLATEGTARVGDSLRHSGPTAIAALLYVGGVSTLIGYVLWAALLKRNAMSHVVPFTLLVPVIAVVASVIFLGEHVTAAELGGAALVMAGVFLTTRCPAATRRRRSRPKGVQAASATADEGRA